MAKAAEAKQAAQPQSTAKKSGNKRSKVGPAHAFNHFDFSQGFLHGTSPCLVGTQSDLSEADDVRIGDWLFNYAVLQKRARGHAAPCESGDAAKPAKKQKGKRS